ncbi:MAG TPA: hypothetical protein VGU01_05905 [Sphingomicrobium sp.]|nr:hypothetical protein [Sphingomicrobium sp.]
MLLQWRSNRTENCGNEDCPKQEDEHRSQLPQNHGSPDYRNGEQQVADESCVFFAALLVQGLGHGREAFRAADRSIVQLLPLPTCAGAQCGLAVVPSVFLEASST